MLVAAPAAAQAEVLVSNIGQTSNDPRGVLIQANSSGGQAFTTGAHAEGYNLESIDIHIQNVPTPVPQISVSIYSANALTPRTSLYQLSNPATFATEANTFTAPAGTVLDPTSTYYVIIENSRSANDFRLTRTGSNDEDSAATGWTISDARALKTGSNAWANSSSALLITVNGTARGPEPTITAMSVTSDPGQDDTYGINDDMDVTVTFSENITLDTMGGTPELDLTVGGSAKGGACAAHATALDSLVCTYQVATNDGDANGVSIAANSLTLEGGAITYRGGTRAANLTHPGLPSNSGHKVNGDPTVPTITGVTITSTPSFSSDTYGVGEAIEISVTFSLPVWVTGNPHASLWIPSWVGPSLHAGNGTPILRFRHTVRSNDVDANGSRSSATCCRRTTPSRTDCRARQASRARRGWTPT